MAHYHWIDLTLHPDSPRQGVERVCFGYDLSPDNWRLAYEVFGQVDQLELPAEHGPRPGHELWKSTCFELFIARSSHGYRELNMAPSGAWGGFDFDGYRSAARPLRASPLASLESSRSASAYRADIVLSDDAVPDMAAHLGPAVVLKDVQGQLSYWALLHAPGKPDFHHPDLMRIPVRR